MGFNIIILLICGIIIVKCKHEKSLPTLLEVFILLLGISIIWDWISY